MYRNVKRVSYSDVTDLIDGIKAYNQEIVYIKYFAKIKLILIWYKKYKSKSDKKNSAIPKLFAP